MWPWRDRRPQADPAPLSAVANDADNIDQRLLREWDQKLALHVHYHSGDYCHMYDLSLPAGTPCPHCGLPVAGDNMPPTDDETAPPAKQPRVSCRACGAVLTEPGPCRVCGWATQRA